MTRALGKTLRGEVVVDHIFFDLDGTLVDSLPGIQYAVEAALRESGIHPPESDLRNLIGPPIRSILQQLAPQSTDADLDRLERSFRLAYDSAGWMKARAFDRASETLEELRQLRKEALLVTNKPLQATEKILNMLGIAGCFAGVLTRDSRTPPFESKAAMLSLLLSQRGIESRRCLMVGDALEDYEAASEVGMQTAIMLHGYGSHKIPIGLPSCHRLNNFRELISLCSVNGGEDD
jgi:phosphoglycolate phosphatase